MKVAVEPGVIELHVQSIAAGGDGVGRSEGLVVFVPRTAPGDVALVRIERGKRFARGQLETLLTPSPVRVEPHCKHYTVDRCGGCQLQHLRYPAQVAAKQQIVTDAIARIAKRNADVPSTRASKREWRYRMKLTLTLKRVGNGWVMGLHPFDDPVGVFQLDDCPITDERIVSTWREIMSAGDYLPDAAELRGTVRLADEEIVVQLKGAAAWPTSQQFFSAIMSAAALWWTPDEGEARLLHERRQVPTATSFAQVNREVAVALREHVVDRVMAYAPLTVVDAYGGVGDTAAAIAAFGVRVTAIELDRVAAAFCATRLPSGSRSLMGRVESLLIDALPADVIIVNPPRVGLHERVTTTLERQRTPPRAIFYVSCDPATLARDLARMPRYRIASIESFDMFPQTAHVETVCELVPAAP
jgi:23S rRNA (uracil1939-C5)-methyltransferase